MYRELHAAVSVGGPAKIDKNDGWYIATFIPLNVVTQGRTEKEAKKNLEEAVMLYIESAVRRGVLEEILREKGFKKASRRTSPKTFDLDIPPIKFPSTKKLSRAS